MAEFEEQHLDEEEQDLDERDDALDDDVYPNPQPVGNYFKVADGVWGQKDMIVNYYMVENETTGKWVLVDAGLKTSGAKIRRLAEHLFETPPECIVLTHGHFDHVGALQSLADEWDVPVYAHPLEYPYLTGLSAYPPPDSTVGGGLMASLAWMYPKAPIRIGDRLRPLPSNGSIPELPGWRFIHTPGHAPGHVSLYREQERVLIAGDAFVTTEQESLLHVMLQVKKLSGPPKYFTPDWVAAARSVRALADLEPEIIASGHGPVMKGASAQEDLEALADDFATLAVPEHGRYVDEPALMDETGVIYVPPEVPKSPTLLIAVSVAGLALITWAVVKWKKR